MRVPTIPMAATSATGAYYGQTANYCKTPRMGLALPCLTKLLYVSRTRPMSTDLAPPPRTEFATIVLRLLALCGVALKFYDYEWSLHQRPEGELFYAAVAAAAGILLLRFVTPRATKLLLRHKGLLVPCGCYLLASEALAWFPQESTAGFFSQPTLAPTILIPAIVTLAAALVIAATFAAWQTLLIMQAVTSNGIDLTGELRHALTLLPRAMAIVAVAYVVIQGPFFLAMWYGFPTDYAGFMVLLVVWAIYCLSAGVVTCLWLPLALDRETPFWDSLSTASQYGIANWRSNAKVIVPWAIASGWITLRYISSFSFGHNTEAQWNVKPTWYGDYLFESQWYSRAAVGEAPELLWFAVPMAVLFAATSIAVKITLVQRLDDDAAAAEAAGEHLPTYDS